MSTKKLASFLKLSLFILFSFIAVFLIGFIIDEFSIEFVSGFFGTTRFKLIRYIVINFISLFITYIICNLCIYIYKNIIFKLNFVFKTLFFLAVFCFITGLGYIFDEVAKAISNPSSNKIAFSWVLHYISFGAVFVFSVFLDTILKSLNNLDSNMQDHEKMQSELKYTNKKLEVTNKKADKIIRLLTKKK